MKKLQDDIRRDSNSPTEELPIGILSQLNTLKLDDVSPANSPFVKTPATHFGDDSLSLEYMFKGEGKINSKFYPLKKDFVYDESNSESTPNSEAGGENSDVTNFTTFLKKNSMRQYYNCENSDSPCNSTAQEILKETSLRNHLAPQNEQIFRLSQCERITENNFINFDPNETQKREKITEPQISFKKNSNFHQTNSNTTQGNIPIKLNQTESGFNDYSFYPNRLKQPKYIHSDSVNNFDPRIGATTYNSNLYQNNSLNFNPNIPGNVYNESKNNNYCYNIMTTPVPYFKNHNMNPNLMENNTSNNFQKSNRNISQDMIGGKFNFFEMSNDDLCKYSYHLSKDQAGCRYLQKKIEDESEDFHNKLYQNIAEHIIELINDSFGNYLIQKLFDNINHDRLYHVFAIISPKLTSIGINPHGTRVIQRLVDRLNNENLSKIFIKVLKPHVVSLIKDLNGGHILLKVAANLNLNITIIMYEELKNNLTDISTHKHGCCVLQKLIENSNYEVKTDFIDGIIRNVNTLILDQYGNYIVQYVLIQKNTEYANNIVNLIKDEIFSLSKGKFSSNVIEKLFNYCDEEHRNTLLSCLMPPIIISELVLDMYGNYVIQKALAVCNEKDRDIILRIIAPLMERLRFFIFGPKLYNKLLIMYPQLTFLMFSESIGPNLTLKDLTGIANLNLGI